MRASRGYTFPGALEPAVGNGFPKLSGGEPMTALLAACGKHFAAARGLHSRAESVRLGAPAFARLKCALWQNSPPLLPAMFDTICNTRSRSHLFHPQRPSAHQPLRVAAIEFSSVFDPCAQGQETCGVAYGRRKVIHLRPSAVARFEPLSKARLSRVCRLI